MGIRIAYPLGTPPVWHGYARNHKDLGGIVPIVAADLVAGGIVQLFRVPAGFVITGAAIDLPQLDSGNTLTLSLGTIANPTLLLNASTAARAAAAGVQIAFGARGFKFATDADLILTAVAAATTPLPGSAVVFLGGFIEPVS